MLKTRKPIEKLKTLSDKNKAKSPQYVSYIDPNQKDTYITNNDGTTWTSGNVNYAKPQEDRGNRSFGGGGNFNRGNGGRDNRRDDRRNRY